jgi:nucleotide-binding universal stress UspA family protein
MSIIAAVDLSPASVNAARSAALLARMLNQPLLLVRAVEPVSAFYPELMLAGALDLDDAIRRGAQEALENIRFMLQDFAPGATIETRVQAGTPHEVLIECAREKAAALIVLGSRVHGRVGRLLVGSTSQRTLREAPCPVLVLKEDSTPFQDWVAGKRPLRIVAGVDRSVASESALALIGTLRRAGPCDVTLVHEYWPPAEYARLGLRGQRDVNQDDAEVIAVINRELRELWAKLPALPNAGSVTTQVRSGWSAPGLELAGDAEAVSADLLVMGTTQPHGLARVRSGSDALTALQNCHVPLLVVPSKTRAVAAADAPIPALRTVLVATDLSAFGNGAIPHAYAVARPGARIDICHVHERGLRVPAYVLPNEGPTMTVQERQSLERQLMDLIPTIADESGFTTHVTVIDGGDAAGQILQAAHRLGADAIVVASHGRSGVGASLFGSVARAVLHKSDLPVYVVRPSGQ